MKSRAYCRLESLLLTFLRNHDATGSGRLSVAYSGGPDSGALLAALAAISGDKPPLAIHVDHGLRARAELDLEQQLVRENCGRLGVGLAVARIPAGLIQGKAARQGESIESLARAYRYHAFYSVMKKYDSRILLLAHTRGDQLETLLMRLLGGSSASGLKGISADSSRSRYGSGIRFLRPFLSVEKTELLDYLAMKGLGYSLDSSNLADAYLRNKIRNELIPVLDRSFSGWRGGLDRTAGKAALDDEALQTAAEKLVFDAEEPGRLSISADSLFSAPSAVAIRALVKACARLTGKTRFPYDIAREALAILSKNGSEARFCSASISFCRQGERLELRYGLDFPQERGYFVMIDRPRRMHIGRMVVHARWQGNVAAEERVAGIRADAFQFPLIIRSRRPGDSISLPGGSKRLDALFSEWALSETDRCLVPVVEDAKGIVAVLGAAFGKEDRYRRGPQGFCGRSLLVSVKGA